MAALLGDTTPDPEPPTDGLAAKLELLNEQFARETERKRRNSHFLSLAVLIIAVLALLRTLLPIIAVWIMRLQLPEDNSTVIGGAEEPIAISVVSKLAYLPLLAAVAIVILAAVMFHRTRKR